MGRSLRNAVEYARHGDLRVELVNRFRPGRLPKLLPRPISTSADCSPRRINRLLAAFPEPTRYLEIGVFQGSTLENVCATYRCGVEPRPKFDATKLPKGVTVHVCTSDEFFADLDGAAQFDVVFLDGLHTFEQTYRDLINALRVCPRGFVLIDDVVPVDSASANPDRQQAIRERKLAGKPNAWHGDVFKVIVALSRYHSSEVSFCTIVDKGNPQTLAWRKSLAQEVRPVDSQRLAEVDGTTFEEVFASGVPDGFVPKEEEPALAWALSRRAGMSDKEPR